VTDPIDYEKDAKFVYFFLRAVGRGSYSRLGVDVGIWRTFSGVETQQEKALEKLAQLYIDHAYPQHMKSLRRWLIKAKHSALLRFEVPNDSHLIKTSSEGTNTYYIISHPINHVHGIFSRSTRVYLAISKADFDAGNFDAGNLRTLKLSWQSVLRHPEIYFYEQAHSRNNGVPIKYLAQAIAGGSFESTLQKNGRFLRCGRDTPEATEVWASFVSPLPTQLVVESNSTKYFKVKDLPEECCENMRELQWIIFKDVGKPLHAFEDIRTPIQALSHALEGM
jgi:hypothetical protein